MCRLPATAAVSETTEMEVLQTDTWREALELKAAQPDAVPIAGGTDLMVELNFDRIRPRAILDLTRIPELTEWGPENGRLRVGAGVTYSRLIAELGDRLPGLAIAARTGPSSVSIELRVPAQVPAGGLSLARALVAPQGGRVEQDGAPGQGALVRISLARAALESV